METGEIWCSIHLVMPSRNVEKVYLKDTFYHVYNRGVNRCRIFRDEDDYTVFMALLKRYLSDKPAKDKKGRPYIWLHDDLELLAFCLMPNHFHLFIFQISETAITTLLRAVCTSYTKYYNQKYQRVGHLFQDRFKASMITSDPYLQHISRYIHLNPQEYLEWPYSSLPYYLGSKRAEWVTPNRILEGFKPGEYEKFISDYRMSEEAQAQAEDALSELANVKEDHHDRSP